MNVPSKAPLSVLIPVKNEETNIAACLESVAWCDDVVVVDSSSTDRTREMARAAGARVIDFIWNGNFPKKKNWALANISWKNDWVFIIDADERATPQLAAAMRAALSQTTFHGYYVNRRFWFLDGWLNHCGYFPSWNLRFFRHAVGRYEQSAGSAGTDSGDNEVHEHVQLTGLAGYLDGEMEHYAFPDVATWVEKHNRYSNWEARQQVAVESSGNSATETIEPGLARKRRLRRLAWSLPFRPTLRFCYHYFWRAGFLDGYRGYVFCRLMAWYEFLSAAKAHELRLLQSTEKKK